MKYPYIDVEPLFTEMGAMPVWKVEIRCVQLTLENRSRNENVSISLKFITDEKALFQLLDGFV